jgi:hypothetical protein
MKEICLLAKPLFLGDSVCGFEGIPYHDNTLSDALVLCCRYSDQNGKLKPSKNGLKRILQIALGIEEDRMIKGATPVEIAMNVAYEQFRLQETPLNSIGRMWHILNNVWNTVPDQSIAPLSEIMAITGLSYSCIICYGMAAASCDQGFIAEYSDETTEELEASMKAGFTIGSHHKFLQWISCNLADFSSISTPPAYVRHPVVNSGIIPPGCTLPIHFSGSPNGIISRVSSGIYFDLIDRFNKGGNKNQFKTEFGYAFEKYVGEYLSEYLPSYEIVSEIEFGPKKARVKSVDYFVKKGNTLILIEVKQSSIFAAAKFGGTIDDISDSLSSNIEKAIKQLNLTFQNLKIFSEFSQFSSCSDVLKLVVVGDPLYNANNIIKLILESENNVSAAVTFRKGVTPWLPYRRLESMVAPDWIPGLLVAC